MKVIGGRERVLRVIAAWWLPLVIWLFATLYLGGALGKNTDDYSINFRDPVTNAIPQDFNPFRNYPFFWRPLHVFMCFTVGTFVPSWDRAVHLCCAVFHGLACLGLFLTLRRVLQTTLAAASAALLFMVLPLNGEVPFWFCTTSTAIGVAITFGVMLLVVRFARARTDDGEHRWGLLVPMAGASFIVPCWYEQSAAPLAGVAVLYLACCPSTQRWMVRLTRAAAVTAVCGAMCMLYVALLLATAPKQARGGAGSIVTADRLAARLNEFSGSVRYNLGERAEQVILGSFSLGVRTIIRPESVVWACVLLAAGVLWLVWIARRDQRGADAVRVPATVNQPTIGRARAWMAAFGVIVFFAGWLPVLVIDRQIIELRNLYVPLLGAAVVLAVVLDVLVGGMRRLAQPVSSVVRVATAIVLLVPIMLGAIGMVGFQRHLQARAQQDQSEIRQLVAMVPNPPSGAVFAPFRTSHVTHTGHPLFDRSRFGVFETSWSGTPELRRAYRRADVSATVFNPWAPLPLVDPDERGIRYTLRPPLGPSPDTSKLVRDATTPRGELLPWETLIPFVVDAEGRVKLIRRIDIERADHRDVEIKPAVVADALTQRAEQARIARQKGEPEPPPVPTITRRFGDEAAPPELIPLGGWAYLDAAGSVQGDAQFAKVNCWEIFREATWLSPMSGRSAMRTLLAPMNRPEHMLLRATIGEYDLNKIPDAPAVDVVVTATQLPVAAGGGGSGGGQARELGVLRLEPKAIRQARRWLPLVVTIPPRGGDGVEIRVLVRVAADGDAKPPVPQGTARALPPIWVTQGYQQSIPLSEGAGRPE